MFTLGLTAIKRIKTVTKTIQKYTEKVIFARAYVLI